EYESTPIGWLDAAGYGAFALPEPSASNDRHVMLLNFQRFERPSIVVPRVARASAVTVRYAATKPLDDRGPLTYTLFVNGESMGSHQLVDTGGPGNYIDDTWDVAIPSAATIEVRLDGNIMWVDRIEVTR